MFLVSVDVVPLAEIDLCLRSTEPDKVKHHAASGDAVGVMSVLKQYGDHEDSACGAVQSRGARHHLAGGCKPALGDHIITNVLRGAAGEIRVIVCPQQGTQVRALQGVGDLRDVFDLKPRAPIVDPCSRLAVHAHMTSAFARPDHRVPHLSTGAGRVRLSDFARGWLQRSG